MKMPVAVFISILILASYSAVLSSKESTPLPDFLRARLLSHYKYEQVKIIDGMFFDAGKMGLPVKYLLPRISEAQAKKVPFDKFKEVFEKKINSLQEGYDLVWILIKRGIVADDINEHINFTAELIERGLKKEDVEFVYSRSNKDEKIGNILKKSRFIVILRQNGYSLDNLKDVAKVFCETNIMRCESLSDLLIKYPSSDACDVLVKSLKDNINIKLIEDKLIKLHREDTVREVLDDRRPER